MFDRLGNSLIEFGVMMFVFMIALVFVVVLISAILKALFPKTMAQWEANARQRQQETRARNREAALTGMKLGWKVLRKWKGW